MRSGETEAYFSEADPLGFVLVVHHIQKTAGSSFRQLVRENLTGCELEALGRQKAIGQRSQFGERYASWYKELAPERRAKLRCVMSHSAGFLLPVLDRPAQGITLVRDPVDRVLSRHHFATRAHVLKVYEQSGRTPPAPLEEQYREWGERDPPKGDTIPMNAGLFNWQARSLMAPWFDVSGLAYSREPSSDADLWRERLFNIVERFIVGTQENYPAFVESVCARFGWSPHVHCIKKNPERPTMETVSRDLLATIRAYNWLDRELHEQASLGTSPAGRSRLGSLMRRRAATA
jgi:hypothetical protein